MGIVVQAQPKPAAQGDGEPAWRRILCGPPQEASDAQVLDELQRLEALPQQAECARRLSF